MTITLERRPIANCELPLRVLLVEDSISTRQLLLGVISSDAAFVVVGEAVSGDTAMESAAALNPDVVLLDLSLPDIDGADLLPHLLTVAPDAKVVVLSKRPMSLAPGLVAAGAVGFIAKGLAPGALLARLSEVLGLVREPQPSSSPSARSPSPLALGEFIRGLICDADPLVRRMISPIFVEANIPMICEVVSFDDVPLLCMAVYLTRPDLIVIGENWLTTSDDLIARLRAIAPDAAIIAYTQDLFAGVADDARVRHVERPGLIALQLCIEELLAVGERPSEGDPATRRIGLSQPTMRSGHVRGVFVD